MTVGNTNNNYGILLWGDYWGAQNTTLGPFCRSDGANNNPPIQFPDLAGQMVINSDGGQQGMQCFSGSGPPHGYVDITSTDIASTWRFTVASHPFESDGTPCPVRFSSVTGITSSPTITIKTVQYYAKYVDATHFTLWTDAAASVTQVKPSVSGTARIMATVGPRYDALFADVCPNVGDMYIRIDTPSTSLKRMYVCTARGATVGPGFVFPSDVGTWLGVK